MAVLTTLIYKSQLNPSCKSLSLLSLVEKAKHSNTALDVTGILLFDGVEFLGDAANLLI
ncbi:BLUF domain-containing protein [Leclercia sp. G3L]|uniref:BLUF domain-containing protein n=1 Tax=Leclercia sp. G3L TaxID=2898725 RepID=UPI001E63004B|nr:BLUF domain-containing protein [Leclercia sp. G3L]UGB01776.1 BLUF domain-containing protein [Leclercia sp. G3L]